MHGALELGFELDLNVLDIGHLFVGPSLSIFVLPGCSTASLSTLPSPTLAAVHALQPGLDGFALLGLYARAPAADLAAECAELLGVGAASNGGTSFNNGAASDLSAGPIRATPKSGATS